MRMMNKNAATLKPRNQLPGKVRGHAEAPGGVQKESG